MKFSVESTRVSTIHKTFSNLACHHMPNIVKSPDHQRPHLMTSALLTMADQLLPNISASDAQMLAHKFGGPQISSSPASSIASPGKDHYQTNTATVTHVPPCFQGTVKHFCESMSKLLETYNKKICEINARAREIRLEAQNK